MDFKVQFQGRSHKYTQAEVDLVARVMQEAIPLTQGRHRNEFEQNFCEYNQVPHAFAVNTATSALELAAQLCHFKPGDEFIIPSHTFTASAYPFIKKGGRPVWADIDPVTRVVTPVTLAACITKKTRAIVVVHLYGYLADMPAIMELARKHKLLVIEDNAQAIGTDLNGKKAGSFADFGVFSFHSHKNITTLGEGGMLSVQSEQHAALVPMLRHNGHCGFDVERSDYWLPAMGNVDLPLLNGETLLPSNYCLGEVECALGSKLLERLDNINAEKRARALSFIDGLADLKQLRFHRVDSTRHNYHLLVAEVAEGKRDDFMRIISGKHGVQCVVQYLPLHRYDFYRKLGYGSANCPVTDRFFDSMVSFPFHHAISQADLDYIQEAAQQTIQEIFG